LGLGRIGRAARDAVPLLAKALAPGEPEKVRLFAAEAIGMIGDLEPALPELLRVLKEDPQRKVRQRAVWALGRVRDLKGSGAGAALEAVLFEQSEEMLIVRYEAARYLAYRLRDEAPTKAIDVLVTMMNDRRLEVYHGSGTKVSSGSSESGGGAATVTENAGGDGRRLPAEALGQIGRKANRPDVIRSLEEV